MRNYKVDLALELEVLPDCNKWMNRHATFFARLLQIDLDSAYYQVTSGDRRPYSSQMCRKLGIADDGTLLP